ncbi:MAG: prepilin peptidase [SAR202 cluster bacterium]|nr:prepilin peptidase [SAR202 cluster bacterium]
MAIILFVIGASVGSFLNVVGDRLPAGLSLVSPPSHCPRCDRPLARYDMIPLVSYLVLRGRCRYCRNPIPPRVFAIELITGLLFLAIYLQYGLGLSFLVLAACVSFFVAVAIIDLEHGLIYNRMIAPALVLAVLVAPFWNELGLPRTFLGNEEMLGSLYNSLVAGGAAFLIFLAIFVAYPAGMGGGDVRYAGVIGVLTGVQGTLVGLWTAMVAGGIVAIALIATRLRGRKDAIPFGPFMSAGAIVGLLWGSQAISAYQSLVDRIVS